MGVVASSPSSDIFVDAALATLRRHEEDICAEASKFEVRFFVTFLFKYLSHKIHLFFGRILKNFSRNVKD